MSLVIMEKTTGIGREHGSRARDGICGGSRLWIFLIFAALIVVLGLVVGGIYLNIRSLTSSLEQTEILPTYIPVAAVLFTGILVLVLFWKRIHLLVFVTSVICVGVGLLCGITAVLTGTHVIQPIQHFVRCSMYQARSECHCLSPFNRHHLSLEYSEKALTTYVFVDVTSCSVIETDLLQMLFAVCGIFGAIFILCMLVAALALLAYRMERLRERVMEDESYEEIFTVSSSSTAPNADADTERQVILRSTPLRSTDEGKKPASDLIYSPADIPIDYNEACKMRRSHSFTQPRQQNEGLDTAEPNPLYASATLGRGEGQKRGQGQLKEHRQRARRAVTLHNLDSQQLMLILSLQMRYMQENEAERQKTQKLEAQIRGTPTPRQEKNNTNSGCSNFSDVDTQPVKLVHSHTPQPNSNQKLTVPQTVTCPTFYENTACLSSIPLEYENVESCVAAAKALVSSNKTPITQSRLTSWDSLSKPSDGESSIAVPATNKKRTASRLAQIRKTPAIGSLVNAFNRSHTMTSRADSYENIDDVSGVPLPTANGVTAHPLYENQEETKVPATFYNIGRLRRQRNSSNSTSSSEFLDRDPPPRPKSYISAVEGINSDENCHHDKTAENRLGKDQISLSPQRSQNKDNSWSSSIQNYLSGMSSTPAIDSANHGTNRHRGAHDNGKFDIYALPKKKHYSQSRKGIRLQKMNSMPSYTLASDGESHKSAFHKVNKPSYTSSHDSAPCDTDLDDLDPAPRRVSKSNSLKPLPPYSPPPSYECLTASRQSSLRSTTSSSSRTTDPDLDTGMYKQITKKRSSTDQGCQLHSRNGSQQSLRSDQYLNGVLGSNQCKPVVKSYQKLQSGFPGYSNKRSENHIFNELASIRSFQLIKPHSQSPVHHQEDLPQLCPNLARSYEILDEVFETSADCAPDHRNLQGASRIQYDMNSNRMHYGGIIQLANGLNDSDSEFMETVI